MFVSLTLFHQRKKDCVNFLVFSQDKRKCRMYYLLSVWFDGVSSQRLSAWQDPISRGITWWQGCNVSIPLSCMGCKYMKMICQAKRDTCYTPYRFSVILILSCPTFPHNRKIIISLHVHRECTVTI